MARSLSGRSPGLLSIISSVVPTPMFAAISGPCRARCISLTGDLDLYERTLFFILQNNTTFPSLDEVYYHCDPPPSYTTFYTFHHIPRALPKPVHLPTSFRFISIFINIPARGPTGTVIGIRRFHVAWSLHDPSSSTVQTTSSLSVYDDA